MVAGRLLFLNLTVWEEMPDLKLEISVLFSAIIRVLMVMMFSGNVRLIWTIASNSGP